jgi:hypothetical protein
MKRSNYGIAEETTTKIVLSDIGPWDRFLSITNDAENVVDDLAPRLNGRRLFYLDTEGEMTELKVKGGKFDGFGFP